MIELRCSALPHPKPGIYPGISFADYRLIEAVNNSTLKEFLRTPAHARWAMTHPERDSVALRTGDAAHVAILEPKRFEAQYIKSPKFDRRTNAGRLASDEWTAKHGDKAALLPGEWDIACAMRDAAWEHPIASALLGGEGRNELTVIWRDKESDILCKGRIDRFTKYDGWSTVVDLKTARDGSVDGFAKACADYRYHQQAAFYMDGLSAIAPMSRRFIFVVVENEPPHCVSVMELDESAIEEGRAAYRRAISMYADGMATGEWPGYPVGIEGFDIPKWAYRYTEPPK